MILKNAEIFDKDFNTVKADISVRNGRIDQVAPCLDGKDCQDFSGCIIAPGFVDIHIHGFAGADTCDGTKEALAKISASLIHRGVTSFCPTTMTISLPRIRSILSVVAECMKVPSAGASILGVNMEGPYISANRRGAQKAEYVRNPDWKEFMDLFDSYDRIIKLVDIAPECEGAKEFIDHVSGVCTVSMAHTEADYEQSKEAFRHGISHVTHLFNAMSGMHHRRPGAVGAVFDTANVKAELICDGFHIHPAVLRVAFRLLGEDRTIIVSDSMRAGGMPDGVYELGGQQVHVKDGKASLADETIAGSTTDLHREVMKLIRFGISPRQAIRSATINPAKEIGADDKIGSISVGKQADLVIMDKDWNLVDVIKAGKSFTVMN